MRSRLPSRYWIAWKTGEACGLTADPVGGVEVGEPQRGHRRDERRAAGLVTADLDAVAGGAVVVGGVDDAGGEPQHPPLDLVEHVEVGFAGHAPMLPPQSELSRCRCG